MASPLAHRAGTHDYVVRLGDRSLVLAQRLLESITHAPEIEEDMALSNLALDLLGQTRALYTYAAELSPDAGVRDEDFYAYWRDPNDFGNPLLVEQPNGDFSGIIVRQFLYDAYALPFWQTMTESTDPTLAALAAKSVKETTYHLRHSRSWLVRLGDGTSESHRRTSVSLDRCWPYVDELFVTHPDDAPLIAVDVAVDPTRIEAGWRRMVSEALTEARLPLPSTTANRSMIIDGHGPEFVGLITDLQSLARAHPGASW